MEQRNLKYIIVGAGLSGLTTAYELKKHGVMDFMLLESRERVGGRILTRNSIDFGATWFQGYHEKMQNLIASLNVDAFYQYSKGKSILVYSTMAPEHYFEADPNAAAANRIAGGTSTVIDELGAHVHDNILLNHLVSDIRLSGDGVIVTANGIQFSAEKVIVTVPPLIGTRIKYTPSLPAATTEVMKKTHTWMSNAMKVGLTYDKPFWREKGLSGTLIGQVGPVVELYDHNSADGNQFALMGFLNEALRELASEERKTRVLNYLSGYLGESIHSYLTYEEVDWSQDRNTSCETIKSIYMSPDYGNEVFQEDYLDGRLLFSGAETSQVYGGYMEGAVVSGIQAVEWILGP